MIIDKVSLTQLKDHHCQDQEGVIATRVQVIGHDAHQLKLALEGEGILIRYYRTARLRDHVRFTVGKPEQTDAVIAALRRI